MISSIQGGNVAYLLLIATPLHSRPSGRVNECYGDVSPTDSGDIATTPLCHFPILADLLENYRVAMSAEHSTDEIIGDRCAVVFLVEDDFGQSE